MYLSQKRADDKLVIHMLIKSSSRKGQKHKKFRRGSPKVPEKGLKKRRMVVVVFGKMKANLNPAVCTSPNAEEGKSRNGP